MIKKIYLLIVLSSVLNCAQDKRIVKGETGFQRKINAEYKDATTSPLTKKDRKAFEALDFFKFDSAYVVIANLKPTPHSDWFDMMTTTDRVSKERIYGVLSFDIKGQVYQLNIYQGQELMEQEGFQDYLFLPFLDETNGFESYGGGRYIDAKIPEGHTMIIDFNKAYNPYCAYNDKYSCPLVPRENYLKTRIEAGVKTFGKH